MAGYLPKGWSGKRVAVLFESEGGRLEGRVTSESAAGVAINVEEGQGVSKRFVPWSALRYVELLEEAGEKTAISRPPPRARRAEMPDEYTP